MRRIRPARALAATVGALAAALLVAGCGVGSGSATPSSSDPALPLATPSPANAALTARLLTPGKLSPGWAYLLFNGANALTPHPCDSGALAAAKVGLTSGGHVVVEDGTLFDTSAHASAFIKREAAGHSCALAAPATSPARMPLGLARVGDESYSFRSTGTSCVDRILFRAGVVVLELVTPCTESSGAVSAYLGAAVRTD